MNAEQLALYLASQAGLKTVRSLQAHKIFGNAKAVPEGSAARPILEWKPIFKDGELFFERGDFYRCKPKLLRAEKEAGVFRIVLFGESVAAGFPLAPAFTPCTALEDILKARVGEGSRVEVIDLSVPSSSASDQLRACEASAQLQPDCCVFFKGHAWYSGLPLEPTSLPPDRVREGALIEKNGLRASRQRYLRDLEAQTETVAMALAQMAKAMGAEAIFAPPGFNHQWERRNPPVILGQDETAQWFVLFEKAQQALILKDFDLALSIADAMATLEQLPLSSTPERIRAKAYQGQGAWDKARDAAIAAADASCWYSHTWLMPTHHSWVLRAIKKTAALYGATVVDISEAFAAHWQTPFLDYRVYYDHLHLTVEATQVAMTAVAEAIVNLPVKRASQNWNTVPFPRPAPPPLLQTSAFFQGVFWISQFCPPLLKDDLEEVLRTQLRTLATDKNMLGLMKDLLRTRTLDCSPLLHPAMIQASKIPGISTILAGKRLNSALCRSILAVLHEIGDADSDAILDDLVTAYQSRIDEGIDISQAFFRDWYWEFSAIAFNDPQQRQGSPFLKAFWPESSFSYFADGTTPLDLRLAARTDQAMSSVVIELNGVEQGKVDLTDLWTDRTLALGSGKRGLNTLTVRWPKLSPDAKALGQLTDAYALGRDADIIRLHGEIYSLRLQPRPV